MGAATEEVLYWTVTFPQWHESVIAQYPEAIKKELREARSKFIASAIKRRVC